MKVCSAVLLVLVAASLASGQSPAKPAPNGAQPSAATQAAEARAALLQINDPSEYGSAVYTGAQAELIAPVSGIASLLVGYDAVWMQADLSVGFAIGDNVDRAALPGDAYAATLRFAFPVHRGTRSDYALFVGVGGALLDVPDMETIIRGNAGGGARFRAFMTPNVALAATLGVIVGFGEDYSAVAMGARPLGAASVVYYFR